MLPPSTCFFNTGRQTSLLNYITKNIDFLQMLFLSVK